MIGQLLHKILNKKLIIYHKHWQTNPIVENNANRE